jgi:hypothetical protein
VEVHGGSVRIGIRKWREFFPALNALQVLATALELE